MTALPTDIRFLGALALNAAVLLSADRLVRRRGQTGVPRAVDTLLLYLLVQYLAVGLPGLLGVLNLQTIIGVALGAIGVMLSLTLKKVGVTANFDLPKPSRLDRGWIAASNGFAMGALGAAIYIFLVFPVTTEDSLTYHMPAAAQWLRDGQINLLPTWFFNPANTFSPLAGSVFMAWWIAPLGNDMAARFVQLPAAALILASVASLAERLGSSRRAAMWIGVAAILCQPLFAEIAYPMDDLFMAAFFLTAVDGLIAGKPLQFGTALGLMLATKYTALLAIPMFLIIADVPFRNKWRWAQWGAASAMVLLLAGPWYMRNAMLTGNPLFPVEVSIGNFRLLPGMFTPQRSAELTTLGGALHVFRRSPPFMLPDWILAMLFLGWLGGLVSFFKHPRQALLRLCVFGPIVGLTIFIFTSPYPEMRFTFPVILLLFVCWASWLWGRALPGLQVVPMIACGSVLKEPLRSTAVVAGFLSAALLSALAAIPGRIGQRLRWGAVTAAALLSAAWVYVFWQAITQNAVAARPVIWASQYGSELSDAWTYLDREAPPDATIAYANTHLVYPLMGYDLRRRVVYVPTRHGVNTLAQMPQFDHPITGEAMRLTFTAMLQAETDESQWLDRMQKSGARYLLVVDDPERPAPELSLAANHRPLFRPVAALRNRSVKLFEIHWPTIAN